MAQNSEIKKKSGKGFRFLAIFIALLELGAIATALVFIFTSIMSTDIDRIMIGVYIIYGVAGSFPLLVMPLLFMGIFRKRKTIISSLQSMRISKIGPYAPGFKSSGVKKHRFCEYCGYEVRAGERECPECGGPVRDIKSSYIS